jgi:two-component system, OmpR family, phosphate regulon sensor histidine kinase PhoR
MPSTTKGGLPERDAAFLRERLIAARSVLAAAALVFVAYLVLGALALPYAVIGLVVLAAAALIGPGRRVLNRDAEQRVWPSTPSVAAGPLPDAIVASLPDPAIMLDREGRVVCFNARATAMAPALRRGEPASLALRVPEVVEAIRRVGTGAGSQRIEFSERVPLDRWYAAHVVPVPAPGSNDAATGFILMSFSDLTPLRRVEEMRADFIANASHELRTPLASLSGFIETLQGPARDDPAARERFLAIMKSQASRMARLIDDLLSLSRVELNVHVQPKTEVELVSIIRQVADALQMLARDRNVAIAIAAPPGPLVVQGDRDELTRVFENLVENALKYGATGQRVDLTLSRAEAEEGVGEAVVAVRDYGPGIPAEHLPRLTERFYRIDVGQSRTEGGTGLGLALVKHILNRHRGRLSIESRPGSGAIFTVRLPLARGQQ